MTTMEAPAICTPDAAPSEHAVEMRAKVQRLEEVLNRAPQVECPVRHIFAPGIYSRVMTIPKGVVLTGAVHKTEHLNVVAKGRIAVLTDDGPKILHAGDAFVSKPGAKRAGHAIEETVWVTVHATDETDLDKLVEELTESTSAELLGGSANRQLQIGGRTALEGENE